MGDISVIKISAFNATDPALCFKMVESTFELAIPKPITDERTKYDAYDFVNDVLLMNLVVKAIQIIMGDISVVKISAFNATDPALWFTLVESTSELAVPKPITVERTKYNAYHTKNSL
ncbi:hypothetical protein AVEN_29953-1 [Araneus ventricosus]|uniref:Uncharacterized protein n=1 Tax=Araneus ventricosus TaxID=182803 RepID=A0A4Y2GTV5_ARAVE|nr:hypothetical protein AVEN_29953-1 [Araneus ventricosus]